MDGNSKHHKNMWFEGPVIATEDDTLDSGIHLMMGINKMTVHI
jgi:hypothetical protein